MAASFYREVARRVFAQELRDSDLTSKDESDQYAPQYILTPTGAKVNRIFIVGTLIEKEDIGTDSEYWRGRVSDPTGTFTIYAGQYHPEASQFLSNCELPVFVSCFFNFLIFLFFFFHSSSPKFQFFFIFFLKF